MIDSQGHLNVWAVLWVNMTSYRNSFKVNSFEMIQFPNQLLKKINCAFGKISQLWKESEARSFLPTVQFDFSWTLEMFDRQNDWFTRSSHSLKSYPSTICINKELHQWTFFYKWINFEIRHWKNVHCPLTCINLHSLTASASEASNLSPTVQFHFSWTLEMSDQQNDRFTRSSECLSSFSVQHVIF